jgi:hypothetical protein
MFNRDFSLIVEIDPNKRLEKTFEENKYLKKLVFVCVLRSAGNQRP